MKRIGVRVVEAIRRWLPFLYARSSFVVGNGQEVKFLAGQFVQRGAFECYIPLLVCYCRV